MSRTGEAPIDGAGRPSSHVQRKREARGREILHAALAAVRERGYHGTTLDHVAERLGIRKTAIYHYFPDKDALLYACHRESLAELERLVAQSQGCCSSPAEQLAHLIRGHVRIMTETLEGSPLAFEVKELSAPRRAEIVAGRDAYEQVLRWLIARAVERGEFRPVDPKTAVFAILGAINWIARWYRPEGGVDAGELGDRYADYLLGGLYAR